MVKERNCGSQFRGGGAAALAVAVCRRTTQTSGGPGLRELRQPIPRPAPVAGVPQDMTT